MVVCFPLNKLVYHMYTVLILYVYEREYCMSKPHSYTAKVRTQRRPLIDHESESQKSYSISL